MVAAPPPRAKRLETAQENRDYTIDFMRDEAAAYEKETSRIVDRQKLQSRVNDKLRSYRRSYGDLPNTTAGRACAPGAPHVIRNRDLERGVINAILPRVSSVPPCEPTSGLDPAIAESSARSDSGCLPASLEFGQLSLLDCRSDGVFQGSTLYLTSKAFRSCFLFNSLDFAFLT